MTIDQIKYVVIAVILALFAYIVYDKIYDYGYAVAEQKYSKMIADYNEKQISKTQELEAKMTSLVLANSRYNNALIKDIDDIRNGLKGKTLVVYKDGKCTLSQEFLDSRAAAIDRANLR